MPSLLFKFGACNQSVFTIFGVQVKVTHYLAKLKSYLEKNTSEFYVVLNVLTKLEGLVSFWLN